jgi:hypothetical protein
MSEEGGSKEANNISNFFDQTESIIEDVLELKPSAGTY